MASCTRSGIIDRLFIQPAAGDAGGALGAALFVHYQLLNNAERKADPGDSMQRQSARPQVQQ
jgi:carbamoyltransferase